MLQFITHQTPRFGIIEGAVAALNGGCKWIQLRMKDAPIEAVRQTAQQLIPLCKEHEAILVLDDYAQLAADLDITHKNCLRIILEIPNPTDYMNIVSYYAGDCILKILFSSYRNLLIIQSVHHITFILCYTVYGFFMDYLVGSMSYISFCVTNFLFEK